MTNAKAIGGKLGTIPDDLELFLKPIKLSEYSTISELLIGNSSTRECYILERPYKGTNTRDNPATKEINESEAILPGRYQLVLSWSPGFKQIMIEVLNVPGRSGIRMHPANRPSELLGCLAPGGSAGVDMVSGSTDALSKFLSKILPVMQSGAKVWLNVSR